MGRGQADSAELLNTNQVCERAIREQAGAVSVVGAAYLLVTCHAVREAYCFVRPGRMGLCRLDLSSVLGQAKTRRRFALGFARIAVFLEAAASLFGIGGWAVVLYVEGVVSFHKASGLKK